MKLATANNVGGLKTKLEGEDETGSGSWLRRQDEVHSLEECQGAHSLEAQDEVHSLEEKCQGAHSLEAQDGVHSMEDEYQGAHRGRSVNKESTDRRKLKKMARTLWSMVKSTT